MKCLSCSAEMVADAKFCPECGAKNKLKDTFACPERKKTQLCKAHWEEAYNCCQTCADSHRAEEQARREEEKRRKRMLNEGTPHTLPDLGMEFAWIPPGSFRMGDLSGAGAPHERPVHTVHIRYGFWMGVYPVTQSEYQALTGENPSFFKEAGERAPVEQVSWHDCREFCAKLNERFADALPESYEFRLPSEAEWEYACRAGTETEYYNGNSESDLARAGWYDGNSGKRTHPVGCKASNAFGLYDMHGNLWEWCEDVWHESYEGAPDDGSVWVDSCRRVVRGGSWIYFAWSCRSAVRNWGAPDYSSHDLGFRCAVSPRL